MEKLEISGPLLSFKPIKGLVLNIKKSIIEGLGARR